MKKSNHIEITLRTSKDSRAPIAEFLHTIHSAVGRGAAVKFDERRRSECVLVLPQHYCEIRARNIAERLMGSGSDMAGKPLFEANITAPMSDDFDQERRRIFDSDPSYLRH